MFYKKLDICDFQEIQNKIVPYVVDYVTSDVESSKEKFSDRVAFNFISEEGLEKLKKDIPELFECIRRELGSEVVLGAFVFIDGMDDLPIHTDGNNQIKRRTRLHWPILNGESAATIFYEKNDENVESVFHSYESGVFGYAYNHENCHEVDRYILDVPTLMDVKQLHGVEILNNKLPRILLTFRLSNEEEVYQKHFN